MPTRPCSDRRTRRRRRAALRVAALWFAALAACGKPGVSGRVLPAESDRTGLPWQRVEVRLIRGTLTQQLLQLAARHRQAAAEEARQRVLESAKAELGPTADALRRARAALAGHAGGGDAPNDASASVHACLPEAEARLAAATSAYRNLLTQLAPRLVAVGVPIDPPASALAQLRAVVQARNEAEARRLRDEYLQTQLVQHSDTVLAAGVGMDRLCWSVENKQDVAVRFRDPVLLFNGKPLPRTVAEQIWSLPAKDAPLRIPNRRNVDNDVLLPGEHFDTCFYARGAVLPLETVDAYGFSSASPSRGGEWHVQWQDIVLVAAPTAADGDGTPSDRKALEAAPLTTVFTERLRKLDATSEESHLIDALSNSDAARTLQQANATLLACHRAIELEKTYQDAERVVQAIEGNQTSEFGVEVRLRPVVRQLERNPERLARWLAEAEATVNKGTVKRQELGIGQTFQFADVDPGPYTLLAKSTIEMKPKLWLIPVDVERSVAQDLVGATARNLTLRETFEDVFPGRDR